jgi:hypothetical protein
MKILFLDDMPERVQLLREGEEVANLNEFGYDVIDRKGEVIRHVTTGDVRCDLGVCDHENHR